VRRVSILNFDPQCLMDDVDARRKRDQPPIGDEAATIEHDVPRALAGGVDDDAFEGAKTPAAACPYIKPIDQRGL
jgi:hypothetical protein